MFLPASLPADAGVRITALTVEPDAVGVALVTAGDAGRLPRCGSLSGNVQGRHSRTLQDRPCLGLPVVFAVTARKFVCRRPNCPRRVSCERLPD